MKTRVIEKEGRFYKECGVVMLETNKPSVVGQLVRGVQGKVDVISVVVRSGVQPNESVTFNNLYITSDDEIKEGDWIYHPLDAKPIQFYSTVDLIDPSSYGYKKIIATTDTSIGYTDRRISPVPNFCEFPQPSDKFIQAYIEAYNKGEKIDKVLVEYSVHRRCVKCKSPYLVYVCTCGEQDNFEYSNFPKLKDNKIIIKKVKDSWTRDEVIEIAFDAFYQGFADSESELYCVADIKRNFDKWIEENL